MSRELAEILDRHSPPPDPFPELRAIAKAAIANGTLRPPPPVKARRKRNGKVSGKVESFLKNSDVALVSAMQPKTSIAPADDVPVLLNRRQVAAAINLAKSHVYVRLAGVRPDFRDRKHNPLFFENRIPDIAKALGVEVVS